MDPDVPPTERLSVFEREYFIQTRKEIDTEKGERDKLAHFTVLLLTGLVVALASESGRTFALSPLGLFFAISFLYVVLAAFYVRHQKLKQIADRWRVLDGLLKWRWPDEAHRFLEDLVVKAFEPRGHYKRYVIKDVLLCYGLCFPIYLLSVAGCAEAVRQSHTVAAAIGLVLVLAHAVLVWCTLYRSLSIPASADGRSGARGER